MPAHPIPLQAVLGSRLRELREQAGRTQDEVAADVRQLGWRATRATIAKAETGRYRLDLEELLILSLALLVPVAEFVDGAEWVAVRDGAIHGDALRELLAGMSGADVDVRHLVNPKLDAVRAGLSSIDWGQTIGDKTTAAAAVWPNAPFRALMNAEEDQNGEVEQKAARRLGLHPFQVALLSRRLWGCGLSERRDQLTPDGSGPTARGHVTRRLVAELRAALEARSDGA